MSVIVWTTCLNCSGELALDDRDDLLMFFCGHIYHHSCVSQKHAVRPHPSIACYNFYISQTQLKICHLCYRSSTNHHTKKLIQPLLSSWRDLVCVCVCYVFSIKPFIIISYWDCSLSSMGVASLRCGMTSQNAFFQSLWLS